MNKSKLEAWIEKMELLSEGKMRCHSELNQTLKVIRELKEALKFTLHCTEQLPWIVDGPGDITNPMFLGTLTQEGDQKVHEQYLKAKQVLDMDPEKL